MAEKWLNFWPQQTEESVIQAAIGELIPMKSWDPPKWLLGYRQVTLCLCFLIYRVGQTVCPFLQNAIGPRGETSPLAVINYSLFWRWVSQQKSISPLGFSSVMLQPGWKWSLVTQKMGHLEKNSECHCCGTRDNLFATQHPSSQG